MKITLSSKNLAVYEGSTLGLVMNSFSKCTGKYAKATFLSSFDNAP